MSTESGAGMTRQEALQRAAALGLAVGVMGAVDLESAFGATPKPKRGGTLRVGLPGGPASTDNLDPHLEGVAGFAQCYRQIVYSKLTDILPNGKFANQLAESMTANKDATVWTIKLKKGVEFHDGSELTVDDVIYTFRRILDPANKLSAARGNIDMIDPSGMRKVSKYVMTVKLTRPWSDFPAAVGQRYISIIKRGATGPWTETNANGTGAFKLTDWQPGQSYRFTANRNYFESGKPYLDGVDPDRHLRSGGARQCAHLRPGGRDQRCARLAGLEHQERGSSRDRESWRGVDTARDEHERAAIQRRPRPSSDEAPDRPKAGDQGRASGLWNARQRPLREGRPALRLLDPAAEVRPGEGKVAAEGGGPAQYRVRAAHRRSRV